jgi:excisionase family DNA binding protein
MNLLTVQEVADAIKVSESTVRRLIKGGSLTAFRVGDRGQLRVKPDDLDLYIESQRVQVTRSSETVESSLGSDE